MVIIPRLLPFSQSAGNNALVLASDITCHTQAHAARQMGGKIGDELVVAIRCLDENLGLVLTLDATRHLLETRLARLAIHWQIPLKGEPLPVEASTEPILSPSSITGEKKGSLIISL